MLAFVQEAGAQSAAHTRMRRLGRALPGDLQLVDESQELIEVPLFHVAAPDAAGSSVKFTHSDKGQVTHTLKLTVAGWGLGKRPWSGSSSVELSARCRASRP